MRTCIFVSVKYNQGIDRIVFINREEIGMQMNAMGFYEFGKPDVFREIEIEKPQPGDDQVLIKVEGTSVNFADIQTRKGSFHGGGTVFPVVPGLDAAGTVEAVGKNKIGRAHV